VLVVLDATQPRNDEEEKLLEAARCRPALVVTNKSDLESGRHTHEPEAGFMIGDVPALRTSALTGEGIPALRERILALATGGASSEPGMLTNLRHHQAITETIAALDDAEAANGSGIPHEMILLDLYRGLRSLDSLTGATTSDDILHLIFSRFCIGK